MIQRDQQIAASSAWRWRLSIILVLAYALWLRAPHMMESLWVDELHTSWVVSGDWGELVSRCRAGNQNPCYFAFLKLWIGVTGHSELMLRFPSLVAGLGLIVILMVMAKRKLGFVSIALLIGVLAAADRRFVFYSTEARPYAVLQIVALLHLLMAIQLQGKPGWPWRIGWAALGAFLFHLHHTAGLFLLAELVWLGWLGTRPLRNEEPDRGWSANRLVDIGLLFLFTLPAWAGLPQLAERRHLWGTIVRVSRPVEVVTLLDSHLYLAIPVLLAAGWRLGKRLGLGERPTDGRWHEPDSGKRRNVGAWLLAAFIPVVTAWLLTAFKSAPLFLSRYVIASASMTIYLAGWLLASLPPRFRLLGSACTLVFLVSFTPSTDRFWRWGQAIHDRREDWRAAMLWLEQHPPEPATPLLVDSGLLEGPLFIANPEPKLREYLVYPLRGMYQPTGLNNALPAPLVSTSSSNGALEVWIENATRERLTKTQSALLIARGRRVRIDATVGRLVELLGEENVSSQACLVHAFGRVHVVEIPLQRAR